MLTARRCRCGTTVSVHRVQTAVAGTKPVELSVCPECDYTKCKCGVIVRDIHAKRCTCGKPLQFGS